MSANTITELTVARGPRVAMVGAGQLARMTHQAAIDLGIELRVLAGAEDDAAVRAGAEALVGGAGDLDALRRARRRLRGAHARPRERSG
ncbi:MAG: hypothetical protein V9E83_08225 [Baekduia sp.]